MRRTALIPAALIAAAASLALAQQEAPDPNAPTVDENIAPAAEPVLAGDAVDPALPLEDYEASEQISEDLSVSFPVDI